MGQNVYLSEGVLLAEDGTIVEVGAPGGSFDIDSLDPATTPLDGSELVPMLQGVDTVAGTAQDIADLGGGSAGSPTLYKFDFAFNTPGLNNGVTVYTPAVGDVLLDVFMVVTEAFNGTTPHWEVGTFTGTTTGIMNAWNASQSLDGTLTSVDGSTDTFYVSTVEQSYASIVTQYAINGSTGSSYAIPVFLSTTHPLKVVGSQNGEKGGTAIGGSAGAASLYFLIASPVVL